MNYQLIKSTNCPSFEGCKAPICPLDNSFEQSTWLSHEPICISIKYRKEQWRKNQRKIAKVNTKYPVSGFFTISALKEISHVTRRIKGLTERQGISFTRENTPFSLLPSIIEHPTTSQNTLLANKD